MYRNNYCNILVHFVRNIDFDIDLDSIRFVCFLGVFGSSGAGLFLSGAWHICLCSLFVVYIHCSWFFCFVTLFSDREITQAGKYIHTYVVDVNGRITN